MLCLYDFGVEEKFGLDYGLDEDITGWSTISFEKGPELGRPLAWGPIGVPHSFPVEIGEVSFPVNIFAVQYSNADL